MTGARLSIAIVLPDLRGGGAERMHVHLANEWARRGHSVALVLLRRRGELVSLVSQPVAVEDLNADRIRAGLWPLRAYLRRARPDVVLSAMWPLTSISVIAWLLAGRGARLFVSDHTPLSVSSRREPQGSPALLEALVRLTYPRASGIIAVSHGVREDLCRLGRLSAARVNVIHNPAAIGAASHREPREVRERLWGAGFAHHILSVGSLTPAKDHASLIRAFAALSPELNAKLTILGEGPLRSDLERLVGALGLHDRVSMPGFVMDPYVWLRSADLFVLSSRWEGFGNAIVEALECGVPVVSTDCASGPSEILEEGRYGRLVPVDDLPALTAAMTAGLTEPHDRDALVARARVFSVTAVADQYLDCFASATA